MGRKRVSGFGERLEAGFRRAVRSAPSTVTAPVVGSNNRGSMDTTVVYPAPDRPTRSVVRPAATVNETPWSAGAASDR